MSSKNQLASLREQDQVRLDELAKLHESLSSEDDSQRKRLIEMSRRVTLLQVNEKTLSRRYTLIAESEATLRKVRDYTTRVCKTCGISLFIGRQIF